MISWSTLHFTHYYLIMGNWHGKVRVKRKVSISELFQLKEEYKAKQDVTLWQYEGSEEPKTVCLKENCKVKVLDISTKWWQLKHKNDEGYASKYYFRRTGCEGYEKESWYYGAMPREECEDTLPNLDCNREGSFMVRCKERDVDDRIFILSVKHYDEETHLSICKHFNEILNEENNLHLMELITQFKENVNQKIGIQLGNACMLPAPHSDPVSTPQVGLPS